MDKHNFAQCYKVFFWVLFLLDTSRTTYSSLLEVDLPFALWCCIQGFFFRLFGSGFSIPLLTLCLMPPLLYWMPQDLILPLPFFLSTLTPSWKHIHPQGFIDHFLLLTAKFTYPYLLSSLLFLIVQVHQGKLHFIISQTGKFEFIFNSFLSSLLCLFSPIVSNLEAHSFTDGLHPLRATHVSRRPRSMMGRRIGWVWRGSLPV